VRCRITCDTVRGRHRPDADEAAATATSFSDSGTRSGPPPCRRNQFLRIYRTGEAPVAPAGSDFHHLLEAAQHSRSVARTAGWERFVTSTRLLDEIARVLRLAIGVVNDGNILAED
jgi:hypothetical protein